MLGDSKKSKSLHAASDGAGDNASGLTPLQSSRMPEVKANGQGRLLASSLSIHGMHLAAVSGDKVKMTSYLAVGPQFLEIRDRLGRTPLIYAVFGDKEIAVDFLLKAGAKIESHDMFGRTALHYIAHKDRGQSLKAIMSRMGSGDALVRALTWQDGEGSTPIHLATKHPGCKILCIFLKKMSTEAAHVDIQDHAKRTPLHWACLHGNAKAVGMLLSHGANGGISDIEGKTPLHWACEYHPEAAANAKDKDPVKCITLILEKCPTLMNWQDFSGQTCLHAAAMNPFPEIMTALLSKVKTSGSKFRSVSPAMNLSDHGHRTALHWACALGHVGAARALLNGGADSVATDVVGARPLHYAALNGHMDCVRLLVEHGQTIDATDQDGNTALHWATTAEDTGSREPLNVAVMTCLLQNGANLNAVNHFGLNALHVAASFGETDAVKFLASKGLSVETCSEDSAGLTPLMLACQHGHLETAEALISLGASLETRDISNGRCALQHAAGTGNMALVRLLVSKGCDVNAKDSLGQTAAHVLALGGFCDPLAYLMKRPGFELDPQDDYGLTPLHCAAGKGYLRAVELLVDADAKINLLSWLPDRPTALDLATWNNHPVVSEYLLSKNASSAAPILEEKAKTLQDWYRRKIKDQPSKIPENPVTHVRVKPPESYGGVDVSKPPLHKLDSNPSSRVASAPHDLNAIESRKFADFNVPKRFESVKFAPRQSLRKTSEDTAAFVMRSVAKAKGSSGGAGSGGDPPWNLRPVVDRLPSWRARAEPDNVEWNVPCVAGCGSSQGAWNCISAMMLKCAIAAVFDLPSDQEDDFYGMDNALRSNQLEQETPVVTLDESSEERESTRMDSSEVPPDD